MAGKRPPRLIRLRYRDHRGNVNVTPAQLGKLNGTDVRGAMALLDLWLAEGALRRDPDGTLVVVDYRPPSNGDLERALRRAVKANADLPPGVRAHLEDVDRRAVDLPTALGDALERRAE